MQNVTINVRMSVKCAECRRGGAMDSGICLRCAAKAFSDKPMKSEIGRAVQLRMQNLRSINPR